jgi:hypothetical protein
MTDLPPPKPERISDLMRRLAEPAGAEEGITIGRILHIFGLRGFAFLLLVISLLNIVIFMVPFLSFFFGLPMVVLAAQMTLGFSAPVFPGVLRRRSISRAALEDGVGRGVHWLEKIERYIKPRLAFLSASQLERVHGVFALMLAILVTLPIPVVNVPPSIGLFFLAIGLLERDGFFIIAAYAVGGWCFLLFRSLGHIAHHVL